MRAIEFIYSQNTMSISEISYFRMTSNMLVFGCNPEKQNTRFTLQHNEIKREKISWNLILSYGSVGG